MIDLCFLFVISGFLLFYGLQIVKTAKKHDREDREQPEVDLTKLFFFVNSNFFSVFSAIKLSHFIVNTFFHTLQTLKLNIKNQKMKKN